MKYLIVGNGAAGTEAALAIRKADQDSGIVLVTESRYLHYFRPKLVHFLAEDQEPSELIVYDEEFYSKRKIYNILGRKIQRLDTNRRVAVDDLGAEHTWDRLLLATGSKPFVPPIPGVELEGVFTLRSITDAQRIKTFSREIDRVVVIGGGLLGLENAYSLSQLGIKVEVVEFAPWLLPRQLDEGGGRVLQKLLEEKGLVFHLGEQVESMVGNSGRVGLVRFRSGKEVACQAVLVSAGIRGDMDFLQGSGIATNRGIVVDDRLQTNIPGIWAAGDVAEHRGTSYGLWTVAREQGRIAGVNMAGGEEVYEGSLVSSLLKITGINVFSMGDVKAHGPGTLKAEDEASYKKLVVDDDKALAAMVVGDKAAIQTAQKIMAGKLEPVEFEKHLNN